MIDKLTNEEIEKTLHQNFIGRIGCHVNGLTYIVPVSYAYKDGYVYVRSFEGMKLNIMRTNPPFALKWIRCLTCRIGDA